MTSIEIEVCTKDLADALLKMSEHIKSFTEQGHFLFSFSVKDSNAFGKLILRAVFKTNGRPEN